MKNIKKKIINLDDAADLVSKAKKNKKKIVLCHGVYDLLHIGHIHHFKSAKKFGDILIVSITSDKYVNKGPNRPAFDQNLRAEFISELKIVDYVVISDSATASLVIEKIKPNIYCKGQDYSKKKNDVTNKIKEEINSIKKIKGEFKVTNDQLYSSSNLLNQNFDVITPSQRKFINLIKKKQNFVEIKKNIDEFSKIRVLILGESIIDQYIFCEALGKSGKESVLSFKDYGNNKYLGGSLAIARHVAAFAKSVELVSFLGERGEEERFIRKNLEKNIKVKFFKKKKSKTIIKTRFIDRINNNKLIGIYRVDDHNINSLEENKFVREINQKLKKVDLVIVADYGHGIFTKRVIDHICKIKKHVSLNAQINSTNMGFHNIRNYRNIDSIIINAGELRHEMRDRDGNIVNLGSKLKKDLKAKNITVTQGRGGATMIDNKKIFYSPAFSFDVIDKIGAGDAMFAMLSLCLKLKFSPDLSLLLGSLAAAQSVSNIGNSKITSRVELIKTLFHLMK